MSSCTGNGDCLVQCLCECFNNEECEIPTAICTCGHENHQKFIGGSTIFDVYCKSDCPHKCQLIECKNYTKCGQKCPQWLLNCDGGMCKGCVTGKC